MPKSPKKRKASSSGSSEEEYSVSKKKSKKERKKEKKHKKSKRKEKKLKKKKSKDTARDVEEVKQAEPEDAGKRSLKPMTKEEWEKQQSVIRRVYDEETGRTRLIKGDGPREEREVLEEIVSKERHKEINRKATLGDGRSFQSKLGLNR